MIHSAINTDMLARPDQHVLAWRHIHIWSLVRVGMGHPDLQWKVVSGAAKDHGDRASQRQEQSGGAIVMCVDFGTWGE